MRIHHSIRPGNRLLFHIEPFLQVIIGGPGGDPHGMSLNVLIYAGPGTCEFSVNQTLRTLRRFLKSSYDVKLVGSEVLKNDRIPWEESCALFVMPGGRDLSYLREFDGSNFYKRLKRNVKYLGICAGAYFAAERIEFEIGREGYEVKGDRPLKLIETCAKGALIDTGKQFYYSDDPARSESIQAIKIDTFDEKELKVAYNGGCYFPQVRPDLIYARYTSDKPMILLNDDFCLSGVHFEYDPIDCLNQDKSVFSELLKYENERKALIRNILKRLGLQVAVSDEDEKLEVIKIFTNQTFSIPSLSDSSIQIIYDNNYSINSNHFIMYSQICTSTQTILLNEPSLLDSLPSYSVYVADHQICGKGRSNNFWISSPACLQFTLKLDHPMAASHRLPLLQFLMALAVCENVNSFRFKNEKIKARIKWPNDVYFYEGADRVIGKISGILVNCSQAHHKRVNHVLIGVGVNLLSDPSLPNLTHVNNYLSTPCDKEEFLNELLERFKVKYEELMTDDRFPFSDYFANWLHSGQLIENGTLRIKGIDEFGYLLAEEVNNSGVLHKFEPDGNSFDMMRNLIKRK